MGQITIEIPQNIYRIHRVNSVEKVKEILSYLENSVLEGKIVEITDEQTDGEE